MTPSQYVKAHGLPSLTYVAERVGKPQQTLDNWYRENFSLFEVVVAGVKIMDDMGDLWNLFKAKVDIERQNDGKN